MPAIERKEEAAEASHSKELEILGNIIRLRNNMNISLHNIRLEQSKRLHTNYAVNCYRIVTISKQVPPVYA